MAEAAAQEKPGQDKPGWRKVLTSLGQKKTAYMLLFGFAAGLPYALVLGTLYAWLSDSGEIDLETMGVFSLIGLAYAFKFLWSPALDRVDIPVLRKLGKRKQWIVTAQLLIGAALWKRGLLTLADLFRQRYGSVAERMAAIIMIPTSLLWAAAQIRAFGQVLAASSELGVALAITLAAVVVIIYTATGGLWADATTDLVQGVVLIAGLLLILGLILQADGMSLLARLPEQTPALRGPDGSWLVLLETYAVPICGTLVAQELIARILAMRSPQLARRATVGAGFLYLGVGLIPVLLGLIALPLVGELDEPEQVLLHVAQSQLGTVLYVLFVGALVSGPLKEHAKSIPPATRQALLELLLADSAGRLKVCPGPRCGWLFLDESPPTRRRWRPTTPPTTCASSPPRPCSTGTTRRST